MELHNQVAIVTGASEGIGAALARLLAAEGARVVLAARSEEKLKALAARLGEDRTLVVPTDVTEAAQVERLVSRTVEQFGGIDILVNNAGIGLYGRIQEMDWEHFRRMWEVNFFGAVQLTRAALPYLRERCGVVVNISSVAGKISFPYFGGYCATKFALNALSTALRMELARTGVRVVVVCPGPVQTQFQSNAYRDSQNLPGALRRRTVRGISAEQVARVTLRAVRRGRREVVVPWALSLLVGVRALFPAVVDSLLRRALR